MISFKQLVYALAVEKTLHFKKAAESCHVSQSALSTALTELEKQIEIQIFERDNKRVLITPLGKVFLEKARKIKLELEELYQLGQMQKEPLSSPLSVGVIPTIGPYLLPKVLPALRRQYPLCSLRIVEEQSQVLVEMVKAGDIDCAILALPFDLEGLLAFEFWSEDFYWVTHRDDVSSNQVQISGEEIDHSRLMLLKEGHCLKEHALAACKLAASETNTTFNSTSLYTLIQMVAGHMGTTLVPQMALETLLANVPELKAVHLNEPGPHRKIAFVVRPNFIGVPNIELLISLFVKQLELLDK